MPAHPRIIEALRRLQPGRPADEAEYIERSSGAIGRGWNVAERIDALLSAGIPLRALMHGCTGVGKTTEFARWERVLGERAFVVRCGVEGMNPAVAIAHGVAQRLSRTFPAISPPHELRSEWGWALNLGQALWTWRPSDELLAWLDRICRDDLGRPLLVLVDGSDLFDDDGARAWFGPGGSAGAEYFPATVFTAPHRWCLETGPGGRDERIEAVWHLPPFPVVNEAGEARDEVVTWLADGLARRIGGIELFDDPGLLRRIARSSGGVPRHAVILLRQAALAAAADGQIRAPHVIEAERELAQDLRHALVGGLSDPRAYVSGARLSYEGDTRRFERTHPLLEGG